MSTQKEGEKPNTCFITWKIYIFRVVDLEIVTD